MDLLQRHKVFVSRADVSRRILWDRMPPASFVQVGGSVIPNTFSITWPGEMERAMVCFGLKPVKATGPSDQLGELAARSEGIALIRNAAAPFDYHWAVYPSQQMFLVYGGNTRVVMLLIVPPFSQP